MALIFADRVKELSSTTGTGAFTLTGAVSGYQSFNDGIGVTNTCVYCITDGTDWEVGTGTLSGTSSLTRDVVNASSNADALVDWAAGTKYVFTVVDATYYSSLLKTGGTEELADLNITNSLTIGGSVVTPTINRENFIIGGDLSTGGTNPYQRGTSGSLSSGSSYMADRWRNNNSITYSVVPTWAQTVDGLTITSNEASTTTGVMARTQQLIEGYDITKLFNLADFFVLQGKIKSSITGVVYVSVQSSGLDYSYVFPVTVSAGVESSFTKVIPVPTSGTFGTGSTEGLRINIMRTSNSVAYHTSTFNEWIVGDYRSGSDNVDIHAVNGATISIDKFKIEPGSIATPFWTPSYEEELRRCQRYFSEFGHGVGFTATSTTLRLVSQLPTTMRALPSLTLTTTTVSAHATGLVSSTGSVISSTTSTNDSVHYTIDGFTGLTTALPAIARNNYGYADAEL